MAITITNANANINDTTLTYALSFTGKTGYKVTAQILVNGTQIGSTTSTAASPLNVTFTAAALYSAAQGSSLTGAVTFRVTDLTVDDVVLGSSSKTGGTITINYRIKDLVLNEPLNSNTWNMDNTSGNTLNASWTRVHSAFYARLKGYVNGTQIFSRYGFTTSTNFDVVSLGYRDAIIAAMGGTSPASFRLDIVTQFDDGTADYIDLSYTASETTGNYTRRSLNSTTAVTKTFVTLSTIAINNFELSSSTTIVPFTLTTYGSYTHEVKLYVRVGGVDTLIRTETGVTASGNFTIGATERNLILNAMPNTTTATTWASVTTGTSGTTNSQSVATTVTLHADYKPAFGTIAWAESAATTYVKTALGYGTGEAVFLTNKSKVTFTVPTTMAAGATLSNIRVVFAGTTTDSATSPLTTGFLATAGATSSYTITATDSRGRSTVVTSGSIKVRAYTYPTRNKFEVFRTTGAATTTYDPIGTYLRTLHAATAYSVLNAAGVEKNWIRVRIDKKLLTDPDSSYVNILSTSGTTLTIAETGTNFSGYLAANAYSIRIRVYDAFYDLDNDASALEDTDDYSENIQTLPKGQVSLDIGTNNLGVGKLWTEGGLDVAGNIVTDGQLKSTVATGTAPLSVASTTLVSNLNVQYLNGQNGAFYSDIVDSGSGTGHWWIKFKNGTLIKGGTVSFTGTVSTAWGQLFTQASAQTLTYDTTVAFIDEPNVTFTPKSSPNNYLVSVWPYIGTTTNTQWWIVSASSRVSQTYTIEWTAIGRWQ